MICPLWDFHGNIMGSRPSPFKGENQSFPPSRSVICYCCLFSGYERIWTLHSTSTRKSVKHWSNKHGSFHFRKVEVWWRVCCYGDMITTIKVCSFYITSTLQNFNPVDLAFAQIFHILLFYTTLCPDCDITSNLICINQNLEQLGKQECYHNKINTTLGHFESSFEYDNKKIRFTYTLNSQNWLNF